MARSIILAAALTLAGCGDNFHAEPDAGPVAPDAGFPTAPHTAWPQLLPHAGTVLPHPQLVTIDFSDDPHEATDEAFGDYIMTSAWLSEVGADYGVGLGTSAAKVTLGPAPASITDAQIITLVRGKIADGTLPTPPATDDAYIYMIYIPASVTLGADLQGEYGHHEEAATQGGVKFPLAVILDDGDENDTTSTASHELIETASDPYDIPDDGWYVDPPLPDPWWTILGENADMCDGELLIQSGGYAVERIYSNTAAAAGRSPCVPFDPDDSTSDVTVDPPTMPTVAPGGTATFTVTGWSTDAVPDWTVDTYVADYSDLDEAAIAPTWSSTTVNNGVSVTLTLHVPASATSGQIGGLYLLSRFDPTVDWAYHPWAVGYIVQ